MAVRKCLVASESVLTLAVAFFVKPPIFEDIMLIPSPNGTVLT
jgi:hypothetical protein